LAIAVPWNHRLGAFSPGKRVARIMNWTTEYRGITIIIPPNDDGKWRWGTYVKARRAGRRPAGAGARPDEYKTKDEAIRAAQAAIDQFLDADCGAA
jgi:hypothetical protein